MIAKKKRDKKLIALSIGLAAILLGAVTINLVSTNTNSVITGLSYVDAGDENINWNRFTTYDVKLDGPLTITKSGVYHLSGTLTDGFITVVAADEDKVKLILDNVTIINSNGPAIICTSTDDLVIELIGENYLEDGATYSSDNADYSGVVFSRSDLTFQGTGSLKIVASHDNAIVGKDDMKFNSGAYEITAKNNAIRANDSVYIKNGTINILKSMEGIESQVVVMDSGSLSIVATDDGINASSNTTTTVGTSLSSDPKADEMCLIVINGGEVYINASGDGMDSNGFIYLNGGNVIVDGSASSKYGALDSGIYIRATGGSIIAIGNAAQAETPTSDSLIPTLSLYLAESFPAGTNITIKDTSGKAIIEHTSIRAFNHLSATSSDFTIGAQYIIYIDGTELTTFTMTDTVTTVGDDSVNEKLGS